MTSLSNFSKSLKIDRNRSEMLTIDLLSHPEEFQIDSARISAVIGNLRSVSWATRKCVVSYEKLCWYSNIKLLTTKNGQD